MRWKSIGIHIARILLIVVIAVALNRIFIPKYVEDNQDGRVTEEFYREKTDLDVLFFGSSTVYNAISPVYLYENYGFSSYVRANASQTLWQSYYLLEEMLGYETPKVVVFNVLSMKYGEPQKEAYNRMAIDGMRMSSSKISAIKASMSDKESFAS